MRSMQPDSAIGQVRSTISGGRRRRIHSGWCARQSIIRAGVKDELPEYVLRVIEADGSRFHGKAPGEIDWSAPERQTRAVAEFLTSLDAESGDAGDGTLTTRVLPGAIMLRPDYEGAWLKMRFRLGRGSDGRCSSKSLSRQGSSMKLCHRRWFLNLSAGFAALPTLSRIGWTQGYPTHPIRLVAPFPPGGSIDLTARLIGQWLTERLGEQVVIENRPGAGGNVGSESALHSSSDGYTLLLCSVANAISITLYEKLNYNFRDVSPVAGISRAPNVMLVHPSVPAKTVPEFIAYAKANPGKINMGSSGTGTSIHMSGELFKLMTGVNMQHVPYRGSAPMLTDLIAGQVQIAFDNLQPSIAHIKAGKLRALAVTTGTRSEALPDLPTVGDFVTGYEASTWNGICAPKNTPAEIIDRLNQEINAGLADQRLKARLAEMGAWGLPGSPADYGSFITQEIEKWAKVVHASNLKVE
jgi:tripartite-type tricarboxylate transporter receptor subunit TctC